MSNLPEIIVPNPDETTEIAVRNTSLVTAGDDHDTYGYTIRVSGLCAICRMAARREVNLARARDHKKFTEISVEFKVPVETIKKHFQNHYVISEYNTQIIALSEDTTKEAKELITKIFDGNTDFLDGVSAVLKSKAVRLNDIQNSLSSLNDNAEIGALEDTDKQERIMLHRLAEDVENSITKVYQLMDKKIFPFKKEELSNAILSYKLETLSKMLDEVKIVLMDFQKRPGVGTYVDIIGDLTVELVKRFNKLEAEVVQSGGIVVPQPQIKRDEEEESKI